MTGAVARSSKVNGFDENMKVKKLENHFSESEEMHPKQRVFYRTDSIGREWPSRLVTLMPFSI